jgi:hypothetical protein
MHMLAGTLGAWLVLAAHPPDPTAPLFASTETLSLELVGPFRDLLRMRDRDDREWLDAQLSYTDAAGEVTTVPVRLSTRGRFRLQRRNCQFPPLRVDFRRTETEGTVFNGQERLKLVTHCQNRRDDFEQFVLQEYLIYRMYNLFTDKSFQVRLVRIRYVDEDGNRELVTKYAFFIEAEEDVARRHGLELIDDVPVVPPGSQDQGLLSQVGVFQFMIGNSDWSAFQAPPGEDQCCHNVRVIGTRVPPLYPVPYDFDWSGLVNPPYATPAPQLGIRTVRERVYRDICRPSEELEATLARFRERREAIFELIDTQEGLTDRKRNETRRYLDEFFRIIDDPRQVNRQMERACRAA